MEAFDSAVGFEDTAADGFLGHIRQLYARSRRIETPEAVRELPVVRS